MTTPGTEGEVSPESLGKTASSAVGSHCGPKSAKPCKGKPFDLSSELESVLQKGNPGRYIAHILQEVR